MNKSDKSFGICLIGTAFLIGGYIAFGPINSDRKKSTEDPVRNPSPSASSSSQARGDGGWAKRKSELKSVYEDGLDQHSPVVDSRGNPTVERVMSLVGSRKIAEKVVAAVQKSRDEMSRSLVADAVVSAHSSDEDTEYIIPSKREAGDAELEKLKSAVSDAAGSKAGKEIYESLQLNFQFGCYRRQEIHLFIHKDLANGQSPSLRMKTFDPADGTKVFEASTISKDELEFVFGRYFDLSKF